MRRTVVVDYRLMNKLDKIATKYGITKTSLVEVALEYFVKNNIDNLEEVQKRIQEEVKKIKERKKQRCQLILKSSILRKIEEDVEQKHNYKTVYR